MVFYSPGPVLIDSFELPTIYGEEHADLQTMTLQGHDLAIPSAWQLSLTAPG
jgi:hypothetical protein